MWVLLSVCLGVNVQEICIQCAYYAQGMCHLFEWLLLECHIDVYAGELCILGVNVEMNVGAAVHLLIFMFMCV